MSDGDDWLVCDDGTEWADFVGISEANRRVTFYHAKHGVAGLSATNFQEVVGQSLKNLSRLFAVQRDVKRKVAYWKRTWKSSIARLRRSFHGGTVEQFADRLIEMLAAPDTYPFTGLTG